MKADWWDAPLAFRDLAKAIPIISGNGLPLLTKNNFQIFPSLFYLNTPSLKGLSKATRILKKLEMYGIHGKNLESFKSYLRNRKQCIQTDDQNKTWSVTCGVRQSSMLGPLLILRYVNHLPNTSKILDPIMFADDNNPFFSNCNIAVLFATVNMS